MSLTTFDSNMTALANAVRSKFGVTGSLTVAKMVTAVRGSTYTSAGATLAGWDTDMKALGNAIRAKTGGTANLTVPQMTAAVNGIQLGYTSYVDEDDCRDIDVAELYPGNVDRISIILPSGTYTDFTISGLEKEPDAIHFGASVSGYGGTEPSFSYSRGTVTVNGSVPGGRLTMWFSSSYYQSELEVSPSGNGTPGFAFPTTIYASLSGITPASYHALTTDDCLMITFSDYSAPAMLMMAPRRGEDEITPEMEAEYLAYCEMLKAKAAQQSESGGEDE